MLPGFQQYLVDKGFKRVRVRFHNNEVKNVEDYDSEFLSSYGPTEYTFVNNENKWAMWGLFEKDKPPAMFLGVDKIHIIQNPDNYRLDIEGYRILFSKWGEDRYDEIYDIFISKDRYFIVDCRDEDNIIIKLS